MKMKIGYLYLISLVLMVGFKVEAHYVEPVWEKADINNALSERGSYEQRPFPSRLAQVQHYQPFC